MPRCCKRNASTRQVNVIRRVGQAEREAHQLADRSPHNTQGPTRTGSGHEAAVESVRLRGLDAPYPAARLTPKSATRAWARPTSSVAVRRSESCSEKRGRSMGMMLPGARSWRDDGDVVRSTS
jgi:hypothetical protein